MELCIRSGHIKELSDLIELQSLALNQLCTHEYDAQQIAALVAEQARARKAIDELWWVAEVEGAIVGFAALSKYRPQIGGVYVHPHWTRRGIGKALIAALEQEAIQKQFRVLTVMASLTAIPFYRALGYQQQCKDGFWIGADVWIPCLLMKKRLLAASCLDRILQPHWLLLFLLFGVFGLTMCQAHDRDRAANDTPVAPLIQQ